MALLAWLTPLIVFLSLVGGLTASFFTCEAFTYNGDVWMRSSYEGKAWFDYRIGAGGDVAEMRNCDTAFSPVLAPSYGGKLRQLAVG